MANSVSRIRPPALPVFKTCIWKIVGGVQIALDIYLPKNGDGREHPILLFIHGGGWIASNRTDYSRPLFQEFLSRGFVVVSIDYRLLPESPLSGQLEDIRDIENWLRNELSSEIAETAMRVSTDNVVVAGGSAGAHLALLTPKLWTLSPVAILSLYGPTNLHRVPYLQRGRLPLYKVPACTHEVLAAGTNYAKPPTDMGCPAMSQAFSTPRSQINLAMFRGGVIAEFLLNGLTRREDGNLEMPAKGSVSAEEIDDISPHHLSQRITYPPTYQIIGTIDDIFAIHHVTDFHSSLTSQGIKCEKVIVPEKGHAFDIYEEWGGKVHREILGPAVEWVAGFVFERGSERERERGDEQQRLKKVSVERNLLSCCC